MAESAPAAGGLRQSRVTGLVDKQALERLFFIRRY
jgi:hypothetical protein